VPASSQMKAFLRQLESQGFSASKTRGGHWRLQHPNLNGPVFAPDTPSDHRSIKNTQAILRRKMQALVT